MLGIWKATEKIDNMTYWFTIRNNKPSNLVLVKVDNTLEIDVSGILELAKNELNTWDVLFDGAKSTEEYSSLVLWGKNEAKQRLIFELPDSRRFQMIKAD